ncbi:AzlD domain-containing protein [Thermaerobacillus caldiproteolyticus]|uniref:Branched-subunit amino acid transport protein n=1 Tax=Thermaerobacillus caldiproteolyticus TaxID=247480 RepID=A0A7V9Z6D0_9BACL|nr:AzlD domain-containing protein [Anoxybacillus caldiproteolyticus]MBA2874834.1 branched-subunit amino acid transport protein [Anoxybacillus caldiproteolyticus]
MHSTIVWMIIGMGIVTYIPRMLPLVVFHNVKLPPFLQGVLKNVPYATLGALIVPGIFFIHEDIWFGILGFLSAFIAAWLGANVILVVLTSVAVLSIYAILI